MSAAGDTHLAPCSADDTNEDHQWRYKHLDHVCRTRRTDELRRLLASGWDVNECFFTNAWAEECHHALNLAVWHAWLDGVHLLLDAGAATHKAKDVSCRPVPLMPDAVINFCNLAATASSTKATTTPMTARRESDSCSAELERCLDIVRLLIKHGCDVNRAGDDGLPVLHVAAQCRDARVLRLLLSAGAQVNPQNDRASAKGRTPLTKAVDTNNKTAVKLLLQYGADVSVRRQVTSTFVSSGGRTRTQSLVARSLELRHVDITELLVRAGATVTSDDRCLVATMLTEGNGDLDEGPVDDGWETEEEEVIVAGDVTDNVAPNNHTLDSDANVTSETGGGRDDRETAGNCPRLVPNLNVRRRSSAKHHHLADLVRLTELMWRPLPLKCLCRRYLRQIMGFNNLQAVRLLTVPRTVKEFLLCRDL